jgi:hypothetical protein
VDVLKVGEDGKWQAKAVGTRARARVRAGCRSKRPVQSRAVGEQGAHLGVETGSIIEREMELLRLRPPGREAAAVPTAAASFQEPRRLGPLSGKQGSARGCCRAILR